MSAVAISLVSAPADVPAAVDALITERWAIIHELGRQYRELARYPAGALPCGPILATIGELERESAALRARILALVPFLLQQDGQDGQDARAPRAIHSTAPTADAAACVRDADTGAASTLHARAAHASDGGTAHDTGRDAPHDADAGADLAADARAGARADGGADGGADAGTRAASDTSDTSATGAGRPDALAVLALDGLWLARGKDSAPVRLTGDGIPAPHAGVHVGELLALMRAHDIAQLWLHPSWALAAGLPSQRMSGKALREGIAHPFAAGAWDDTTPGAWGMYGPGRVRPWMRFYVRGASGSVAVSLPHLDGRLNVRDGWQMAPDGAALLAALCAYRDALGFTYASGPGATSAGILRALHRRNRSALDLSASMTPADFPPPAREPALMPQIGWIRPLSANERARGRYVHGYDKNGMFLAACSSLRVGFGAPALLDTPDALAPAIQALTSQVRPIRRPVGYWHARVTFPAGMPAGGMLPHPCYTGPRQVDPASAAQWYHTATLALAGELGAALEIDAAYLWSELHEPLEPWYQHIRDARARLMLAAAGTGADAPAARYALSGVKDLYRQGLGWLDAGWLRTSENPEPLYRPDWRHAAVATANANLWRNLAKVHASEGRTPFAVLTDAAYFVSDEPDPVRAAPAALRLGDGLGQYKVKLAAFPVGELAHVWDYFTAGRDGGFIVSAFTRALGAADTSASAGDTSEGE